ncbi:sensor histidine kinase [Paracidobacterium acidisoli]|nr:histidine kinase [Paracidobacterium acidisoli]MBT9329715.1 histidine kinase [Paracidobacterium acidisoli]
MARSMKYSVGFGALFFPWEGHFLLWGIICQIIWWKLRGSIQRAALPQILTRWVVGGVLISVLEEAVWIACFPKVPLHQSSWTYLHRLRYYVDSELLNNLVIFWVVFFLFRGIGYYQKLREQQYSAMRLESELVNAQLRALRMQLNPHFLFNTMNSISSLMRSDVEAADIMLERMSSMLRMTLDRGDAQLIPLTEEIEFIQLYLSIQKMRFQGTVHHYVAIDPEVHDALVPAMILQPVVENAYLHGVARTVGEAFLGIEAQNQHGHLRLCVRNSGRGIEEPPLNKTRERVGIANVKNRLELHYGIDDNEQRFTLQAFPDGEVQAILMLPLQFQPQDNGSIVSYEYGSQDSYCR